MPDGDIDLGYAIGLPPERAIAYFEERGKDIQVIGNWREMWQEAHARAFTVANGLKPEIVKDIYDGLDNALKKGLTERQFIDNLRPKLKARGWLGMTEDDAKKLDRLTSPHRLKTIFQTNMNVTYAAAKYETHMQTVDEFPFWQYDALNDARTRPSHAALDNLVFRYDDPFWNTHYPPNGFNCRCRVVAMDQDDLDDEDLSVTDGSKFLKQKEEPRPGRVTKQGELEQEKPTEFRIPGRVAMTPDPGWSHNPARAGHGTLQDLNIRKMEERRKQAEQAGRAAQAVKLDRQTIRDGIRSDPWRHFIETAKPQDNNVWPVATITPDRLQKMKLPDQARLVKLDSQGVARGNRHRTRYRNYTASEWAEIQEVIDNGEIRPAGKYKVAIYRRGSDGGMRLVILAHKKGSGEVFLMTTYPTSLAHINDQIANVWGRHE